MSPATLVATGPRELRYPSSVRAGFAEAAAGFTLAVTGGAGGTDTQAAWGAYDAGVPFEIWFPNPFYTTRYLDAAPLDLQILAARVRYVIERLPPANAGELWDVTATWGRLKWWVDNFTRNEAMVAVPDSRLAVGSAVNPRELNVSGVKGGTAHCVRAAVRAGHTRCLWVHDAPEPQVEEVELAAPPPPTLFDPPSLDHRQQ